MNTKDAVNDIEGNLVSATARSITLDLNARPCDDRAPLRHMMEERKSEKLRQHRTQATVAP